MIASVPAFGSVSKPVEFDRYLRLLHIVGTSFVVLAILDAVLEWAALFGPHSLGRRALDACDDRIQRSHNGATTAGRRRVLWTDVRRSDTHTLAATLLVRSGTQVVIPTAR